MKLDRAFLTDGGDKVYSVIVDMGTWKGEFKELHLSPETAEAVRGELLEQVRQRMKVVSTASVKGPDHE